MRFAVVALMALSLAHAATGKAALLNGQDYGMRILSNPTSGDEFGFRNAFFQRGQKMSDQIFGALAKTLGGNAPTLALASSLPEGGHGSATVADNRVNLDPLAYEGLIDENSPVHSGAVNGVPHEMAHLRQTASVLASLADREGGAQAFADDVSPLVAAAAKTFYDRSRNYDGTYAAYAAQARQRGNDWLYGGQFGHPPVQP